MLNSQRQLLALALNNIIIILISIIIIGNDTRRCADVLK